MPRAVAAVAGVGERPGQPLTETLTEVLRRRTALLILDNCEHLIDACAALVETLLNGCPDLRVLATSRSRSASRGDRLAVTAATAGGPPVHRAPGLVGLSPRTLRTPRP